VHEGERTPKGRYGRLLRTPHVPSLIASAAVCYIGFAGQNLALLYLLKSGGRSFTETGAVIAAAATGGAVLAPVRGRLLDRFGQTRVTIPLAIGFGSANAGVAAAVSAKASVPLIAVLATAGGACFPAVFASMRSIWSSIFADSPVLPTAYALEAVLQWAAVLIGPVVVSILLTVGTPTVTFSVSVVLTTGGALLFAASPLSRQWRGARRIAGTTAALWRSGIWFVCAIVLFFGGAEGAVQVAVPAAAISAHATPAGGLLLAAMAAGSMAGGLWYGARDRKGGEAALSGLLSCAALVYGLLIFGAMSLLALAVLLVIVGAVMSPVFATVFGLLDVHAPPGTATESFTWMASANIGGIAVGSAASGVAIQHLGEAAAFAIGGGFALAALLVAMSWSLITPKAGEDR
jgi:MFS family permease